MAAYVEIARQKRRISVLAYICLYVPAAVLVVRLVQVQLLSHDHYLRLASVEHLRKYELPATRGQIYFLDGDQPSPAALNQTLDVVWADPRKVTDKTKAAQLLSPILGVDQSKLVADMNQPGAYAVLKDKVNPNDGQKITALGLAGIGTSSQDYRVYPEGSLAAQVLGFVNSDGQGQYGVEGYLDQQLAGTPGLLDAKTDTQGNPIATANNTIEQPVNGKSFVLTIDRNIQAVAEKYIAQGVQDVKATSGSVVIMDPYTGQIKAMANYPSYDPNNYASVADYSVFENAAVSNQFEPGSGFKVITMSTGLDQGKVTPDTTYNDTGVFSVDGRDIHNADDNKFGIQTMTQVIQKSLNTGAMYVLRMLGGDPNKINMAGKSTLYDYITKHFRFGIPTGVEQQGEAAGYVVKPSNASGNDATYATMTFGQGISVTMMQMVDSVAAIANGGTLYQPELVSQVINPDGSTQSVSPKVIDPHIMSAKAASDMANMMITVVQHGSGYMAKMPGYTVAGKTGTAQIPLPTGGYDPKFNIGSFVGFLPVNHPRFIMMVRINKPQVSGFAESTTVPVFHNIAQWLVQYMNIPPGQ